VGRPSKYSEEIAARICDGLIEGKSLRQLCQVDDMPDRSTVLRWIDADQDFAARCARARMLQADLMDDLIIETAETCTNENAQAARVKIAAYQWRAAKLAPKKYGEKVTLAGDEENPIAHRVIERRVVDPAG
jgi:hypothetical protein